MIQNIYIIAGNQNLGKTTLVYYLLQKKKKHTRKPVQMFLVGGGTTNVLIPRSQSMQEAKKSPQDCVAQLNAINAKYSQMIDVVIVLQLNSSRWAYGLYVSAIQNAKFNITASFLLSNQIPQKCPLPKPLLSNSLGFKGFTKTPNQVLNLAKSHFGWV